MVYPGVKKPLCGISMFVGKLRDINCVLGGSIVTNPGGTESIFGLDVFVSASHDIKYLISR